MVRKLVSLVAVVFIFVVGGAIAYGYVGEKSRLQINANQEKVKAMAEPARTGKLDRAEAERIVATEGGLYGPEFANDQERRSHAANCMLVAQSFLVADSCARHDKPAILSDKAKFDQILPKLRGMGADPALIEKMSKAVEAAGVIAAGNPEKK